jgi:hypothetical protein
LGYLRDPVRTQIQLRMSKPVINAGFEGSTEVGVEQNGGALCLDPSFGPLPALHRVLQAPHSQQ